jgi:Flp pilus assembly protein TadG
MDRGSVAVELVVLTPVLVLLAMFVVVIGGAGAATEQVRHAAAAGARAASLVAAERMPAQAQGVATAELAANGGHCRDADVEVVVTRGSTSTPASVTVTVACTVTAAGTTLFGAFSRRVVASSTEVVDRFRA